MTGPMGVVDLATRAAFRTGAALRGARAFHPRGAAYPATLTVADDHDPVLPRGAQEAVVRFSRGAGLPDGAPDVHGFAIEASMPDGGGAYDLLLSSAWSSAVGRRLLRPARRIGSGMYSSILPYRGRSSRVLFGARFAGDPAVDLDELDALVVAGRVHLELLVASRAGRWRQAGSVEVHPGRLDEAAERALAFDPFDAPPGLEPAGALNRLRRPAYGASRRGRPGIPA